MLFTEPKFLFLFLPLILLCYFVSPRPAKNAILLVGSILFYSFGEGYYTFVVIFSIVFNYFVGHWLEMRSDARWRRGVLFLGVATNLQLLVTFKYAAFAVDNANAVLSTVHLHNFRHPNVHLPVGISFFTFHAISYIVDVYRREVKAMRRFDSFALYITLFPQLIAGPIIRYKTICDQFEIAGDRVENAVPNRGRRHTWEGFAEGVRRFIFGLGKKMLIANIVAEAADAIFDAPSLQITPAAAWLGILCYTLQIYFDFSGYSDMAIGLGRMFGFVFPENFNYPYTARSITEFWRRWHMSLSNWFRDYLYIPLGGNRVSPGRTYVNLAIVFFLCGLWHGATWAFVVWGLFHGAFLIIERLGFGNWLERRNRLLQHAYLLLVVMIGWVFFRALTLPLGTQYLSRMAFIGGNTPADATAKLFLNPQLIAAMVAAVIGSVQWMPWVRKAWNRRLARAKDGMGNLLAAMAGRAIELGALVAIFLLSCGQSAAGTYNPFIYFRF